MAHYRIWTDGGARGNPGPAGAGFVIEKDGKIIKEEGLYLGEMTNNQAEYKALISALEALLAVAEKRSTVEVIMDSELVVEQLKGSYRVKNADLKPLHARVQALISSIGGDFQFTATPRHNNLRADQLVNQAIDQALG